jgi:hypothetical protein
MSKDDMDAARGLSTTEGDAIAHEMFTAEELRMSPEEYAARHGHLWLCFSFHQYRYRDAALGAWMRRLGGILFDDGELARCRARYLSPEELEDVRRSEAQDF